MIRVDDVCDARRAARVIAVTGSVGKTTTKEFIATLLQGRFRVGKTPGNHNSQVTMPLSILNARGDEEVLVIEMGMSQAGEIARLVKIAPPEIALVTPVTFAHVAFFPEGIEGIAKAKAEIFSSCLTRLGIVHLHSARFATIMRPQGFAKKIYAAKEDLVDTQEGLRILEQGVLSPPLQFAFEASHLRENFLGAVAVARSLGMQWEEIAPQVPNLALCPKRFEKVVREGIIFINDSYNANAASTKAALQNLPAVNPGNKKIAVLGAMKELGEYTQPLHLEVAQCALHYVDQLLCLGQECQVMVDLFSAEARPAELYSDIYSLKKRVFEIAQTGDLILLKGSRSLELWKIIEE